MALGGLDRLVQALDRRLEVIRLLVDDGAVQCHHIDNHLRRAAAVDQHLGLAFLAHPRRGRFPGHRRRNFDDADPDAIAAKERVAMYFKAYVKKFNAPIRTGVEVKKVQRSVGQPSFTIETWQGVIEANRVAAATGPFQHPVIPPVATTDERLTQMPVDAIPVAGAGSSGVPIANELQLAGKQADLSVGNT
jgi:cation diffusion facilitator CzcD-associated flavoprotein CzcO